VINIFDSSYRVVHLADGRLQVVCPPEYAFALPFVIVALVCISFFLYRAYRSRTLYPLYGILIFGIPLIICVMMVLQSGSATFDHSSDRVVLHKPRFFWHYDETIPLGSLRYARIRSMRASTYIVLVTKDGEDFTFANSSGQDGQGQAAEAINRYIGATVR
jgi:hypothetical protein